jgi:signal transduction histidine kinase
MLTAEISLLLFVGALNLMVGLAVLSRNLRRPMNGTFFLLAAGVAGWVVGIAAFMVSKSHMAAASWARFYYIAPLIIVSSSALFARVFPSGGQISKRRLIFVVGGFLALAVPIAVWPGFLVGPIVDHSWGKEVILNKWQYLGYSAYLLAAFYLTLSTIYKKTKKEHGLYRAQATVFFDGYLISSVLGVLFNLFLPWFGNYRLIWIGPLASNFYVVATAYGIIRHRLFDVRLVAARAVGYLLSVVALGTLYGVVAFTIVTKILAGEVASVRERAVSAALAMVLAISFPYAKRFFDRISNRLFYQDAYDPQSFIDQLNRVLVANVNIDNLLTQAATVIADNLKAEFCLFGLRETRFKGQRAVGTIKKDFSPQDIAVARHITPHLMQNVIVADNLEADQATLRKLMNQNNIAVLVRLAPDTKKPHEGIGYIVLGAKKSGNSYGSQDIKMLDIISRELLIAIQNALHFEEIENFNVTLQERVDEATRKLRRTNEKLKLLDQTKDDFISMASHQLRTPLTSVKGYVSMVLDGDSGKITPLQRKLLNQSFISAQRMVYLISDLLNVSRLRTGKFVIESVPTNLANVIKDEIDQLVETAASRNLELTYHKPEHFPTLMLDETKIRQVIMNFIDNAIYYTPSGGHITVNLTETPKSIEFTVVDDGIGVPKHEQPHLFSKFYRAQNAQRARPDGTGLGLFMAKKVIVAQGGAIIFRSTEGKGSTFGFSFAKARLPELDTQKV